ncbi:hypothetical protein [uncultured Gimesia sp.]|uniref:hypothetical protein n=1 Tax=uncultured Gimesia sp. TaxID=1678688 RepID=UPI0030D883E0|tara:strand:- start:582 stop:740 length:159 start_codon:yes stop_codon:yes gene_type:complete
MPLRGAVLFITSMAQAGVEEAKLKERFGEQQFVPAGPVLRRKMSCCCVDCEV